MIEHLPAFTELTQYRPQLEANLEGLLQRGLTLRQRLENTQRLFKPRPRVRECRSRCRLPPGLPEIRHCPLPRLAPDAVIGEPLDLFAQPAGIKLFYRIDDARVDGAAAFVEHPAVGNVVGEGVLEAVLQFRKELCRVEKFGSL